MTAYVNTLTTIPYYYLRYTRKNLCGNIQHFLYYYTLGLNFLIIIVLHSKGDHLIVLRRYVCDTGIAKYLRSNTHTYIHANF